MPSAWLELDVELRQRLRDVLEEPRRPVTEAELRKLTEDGRACRLILGAELERLEGQLAKLDSDPDSSFVAIADAFRRVHDFREHVEELDELLSALEDRALEARTSWSGRSSTARASRRARNATYWRGPDLGRRAMSDVLDLESRETPGPVALAGMIGIAKAIFEGFFGLLGLLIANSVGDDFGGGVFVFGSCTRSHRSCCCGGTDSVTTSRSRSPRSRSPSRSSTCSGRRGAFSSACW